MVVAQQECHITPEHHPLARQHAVGDEIEIAQGEDLLAAPDPSRKERERQHVRRRDRQRSRAPSGHFESLAAQLMKRSGQDLRLGVEVLAGGRERHAVRRANE